MSLLPATAPTPALVAAVVATAVPAAAAATAAARVAAMAAAAPVVAVAAATVVGAVRVGTVAARAVAVVVGVVGLAVVAVGALLRVATVREACASSASSQVGIRTHMGTTQHVHTRACNFGQMRVLEGVHHAADRDAICVCVCVCVCVYRPLQQQLPQPPVLADVALTHASKEENERRNE